MRETLEAIRTKCYHCGDDCTDLSIALEDKHFCCEGCKTVYEILNQNGLCTYYELKDTPGFKIKARPQEKYAYLDNKDIASKLLEFEDGTVAKIRFYIPTIHCSSCIWLLENLYKLEDGILLSRVNFLQKELEISYEPSTISLRRIVEVLDSVGYAPDINLGSLNTNKTSKADRSLSYKLGISGFCASNIMLLSFPEYFGLDGFKDASLSHLFSYLNLALALPVVFYGAADYFRSAFAGIRNKVLNLDIPIALGTTAVFLRSVYEVALNIGPGYFDSLTGLVFFLLIGKWIQSKTYKRFSFERDYQSYFPVAVTKIIGSTETPIPIKDLRLNDRILVRNQEIVPADAILEQGEAYIDYSFVTGESKPVRKNPGDLIYAGGKQLGNAIQLQVQKEVSNSYLLQLWNNDVFHKTNDAYMSSFVLNFSKYFVWGTLVVSLLTMLYWQWSDPSKTLFAVTSVLLVACPCALALSLPFALSNALRLLSKHGLYLKNADTVEKLAEIDTVVFDKTGTLTESNTSHVEYMGHPCSELELKVIRSAVRNSIHPLSQAIYKVLPQGLIPVTTEEIPGQGISCRSNGQLYKLGSAGFVGMEQPEEFQESRVFLAIDDKVKGYFLFHNEYRPFIKEQLQQLGVHFDLHLLSGDTDGEKKALAPFFDALHFKQLPVDKLHYISKLQQQNKKVLMLGDGLNDAGALKAADVGIAITEDVYHFSPSCDGLLEGKKLDLLHRFIRYAKQTVFVIKMSLVLSLLYNAAGLYFAVQGKLAPIVAAILMPMSSVTVVVFVVLATGWYARKTFCS